MTTGMQRYKLRQAGQGRPLGFGMFFVGVLFALVQGILNHQWWVVPLYAVGVILVGALFVVNVATSQYGKRVVLLRQVAERLNSWGVRWGGLLGILGLVAGVASIVVSILLA